MSTHPCPAPECARQVPDHLFACRADWYRLPKPLRDDIWRGYHGSFAEHLAAMVDAEQWFADNSQTPWKETS